MIAKLLRRAAAALLFASAATASAQEIITTPGYTPPPIETWAWFDFTSNNVNNNVPNGNYRDYTAANPITGIFNLRVSAWSLQKECTPICREVIRPSKLVVYDGGLGVIAGDDNGGTDGQHTVDNEGGKDFLLLQFSRPTALIAALFNTYSVEGARRDSDITVFYGTFLPPSPTPLPLPLPLALNGLTESNLNGLFAGSFEGRYDDDVSTENSNWRYINEGGHWGDTWIIGATFTNEDQYKYVNGKKVKMYDGFKLASLAVVPEPRTWAMMIAGFGLVGGAMRSRRRLAPQAA